MIDDLATVEIATAMTSPTFLLAMTSDAKQLRRGLCARIGDGLAGKDASDAISAYLDAIEDVMSGIAARHSRGYWMHLTRRLPPAPYDDASEWTVLLYKRVLTLAILKHGTPEAAGDEFRELEHPLGPQQTLEGLDYDAVVEAFALDYLAYEYVSASQAYRRVGKGSHLEVVDDDFTTTPDSDEIAELIDDVDRRMSAYSELASSSGVLAGGDPQTQSAGDADLPTVILAAQPNARTVPANVAAWHSKEFSGTPNFVIGTLDIGGYREALSHLREETTRALGVDADVLLSTIWGLSGRLTLGINASPATELQILRTGYMLFPEDNWLATVKDIAMLLTPIWAQWRGEQLEADAAMKIATQGLQAVTWSEETLRLISLWDRIPASVILDAGGFRLIDYAALAGFVADAFRQVGEVADSGGGGAKGVAFETTVAAHLGRAGFDVWMRSRKLHHLDGTEREIDVGVVAGSTLFVVECKARTRGLRVDRGDWSARLNREETLVEDLAQARTLVEFLEAEPAGADYVVPQGITQLEPLLCTPTPEYIWTRNSDLWLTPDIPRICTTAELVAALTAHRAS